MARIRTIKPEFWRHEDLCALPEATHMLAAALLNYADDFGYFNANPRLIQGEVYPLREPTVPVARSLEALSDIGFLELAESADGRRYGRIVTFAKHQRVSHATESKIAAMNLTWRDSGKFPERVRSLPDSLRPEQGKEQGKEEEQEQEQGKEGTLLSDPRSADADDEADDFSGRRKKARKTYPEAFEAFWREYPTDPIMSKIRAFEKWRALGEDDRAAAQAALAPFRAHCRRNPTYHPVHAERFLSQRRFDGFAVPVRARDDVLASLWGGAAAPLVAEIGAGAFQAYFGEAVFDPGPPARIKIARQVTRDLAREKFAAALKRAVGEVELCG
jgi:hypothetical protein